jgi:hypothetical protein
MEDGSVHILHHGSREKEYRNRPGNEIMPRNMALLTYFLVQDPSPNVFAISQNCHQLVKTFNI